MSLTREEIADRLRNYILQEFLPGESPQNLRDDTPLKSSSILDSVSTLQLVSFVEDTFKISVEPHEAAGDFDRIADIAALIERKR
ncbi:MAG: acyl carrier protein [Phycisphaerae bacterium]